MVPLKAIKKSPLLRKIKEKRKQDFLRIFGLTKRIKGRNHFRELKKLARKYEKGKPFAHIEDEDVLHRVEEIVKKVKEEKNEVKKLSSKKKKDIIAELRGIVERK